MKYDQNFFKSLTNKQRAIFQVFASFPVILIGCYFGAAEGQFWASYGVLQFAVLIICLVYYFIPDQKK